MHNKGQPSRALAGTKQYIQEYALPQAYQEDNRAVFRGMQPAAPNGNQGAITSDQRASMCHFNTDYN